MLLLLFDSVLFMSSSVGGKGLSLPPSAQSVHVTSPGWQQILEYIYSRGKSRQNVRSSSGGFTSEERRKWERLSLGVGE